MVDSIGAKPLTPADRGVARVAVATPAAAPATPERDGATAAAATTALSSTARTLAASAPVDTDRIAKIRKAIANNTFPILPATIADRLIALGMQWNSSDPA